VHILKVSIQNHLEARLLCKITIFRVKRLIALEEDDAVAAAVERAAKPAP
jgi:hypothetical protein